MLSRFGLAARASSSAVLARPAAHTIRRRRANFGFKSRGVQSLANSNIKDVSLSPEKTIVLTHAGSKADSVQAVPNLWLRDNCLCSKCVNQDTRQRNFDTFQIPKDITPVSFSKTDQDLIVEWSDSHTSQHPLSWLAAAFPGGRTQQFGQDHSRELWNSSIAQAPPEVSYDKVMSKNSTEGIAALTKNIWVHGMTFVTNTPPTPEATEALLNHIGPIRTTHYGGFYDFIPDLAMADTAYTNLALPAHTDTTYFTEPAGLQAFHLLSHTAPPNAAPSSDPLGGQSLLVDGFHAAHVLQHEDPSAFRTLAEVPLPWHASGNEGIAITPDRPFPVLEVERGTLRRVRWNNDDRGIVPLQTAPGVYDAMAKWNEILRRRESEFWFQLEPGRVVIFDNWRVMHGRSAFEGVRRICGGYTPHDDFVSRYRTTNFKQDQVIGRNLNARTLPEDVDDS